MEIKKSYKNNFDYLMSCMEWIDKRIKEIYEAQSVQGDIPNSLKGIIISNEDVKNLISQNDIIHKSYKITKDENFNLIQKNATYSINNGQELYLEKLCNIFNLNIAEKIFIMMSISTEIDMKYAKIYGYFNNNINKIKPSFHLALDVMGMNIEGRIKMRESFYNTSLFKNFICHPKLDDSSEAIFMKEIKIDERIINYILGINEIDKYISNCIMYIDIHNEVNICDDGIYHTIENAFEVSSQKNNSCIVIYGNHGVGKKENFKLFLKKSGNCGVIVNLELMTKDLEEFKICVKKTIREAMLCEGIFAVENYHVIIDIVDDKLRFSLNKIFFDEIRVLNRPVFILSQKKLDYIFDNEQNRGEIEIKDPGYVERKKIWDYYSVKYKTLIENTAELSSKFLFVPEQIHNTVKRYIIKKSLGVSNEENNIYESCFECISHGLYKRASKVNVKYTWDHLILPEEQKSILLDVCYQIENKYKVYEEWGFDDTVAYGKGVTVVLSGSPGTGKTMAAQVMSNKLNLELFKIDLSQIVSKYVGETEKNLNEIFNEARISNAILFFDEADALFGKRSEVKSSNDKYSNLETSYLLQKIEEYEGISILATNYLKNIDAAFIRRMKYIINFPFPDIQSRKKIWQVTMPKKAPVGRDIDFDFLAETFEISGGNIKNILVYSAFKAASEKSRICMSHILSATQYEMQKIGKLILSQDLKQYRHLFENVKEK